MEQQCHCAACQGQRHTGGAAGSGQCDSSSAGQRRFLYGRRQVVPAFMLCPFIGLLVLLQLLHAQEATGVAQLWLKGTNTTP